MDTLPQELVDRISGCLDLNDLKSTLFISRSFQVAAEECSGAFRKFELTPDPHSSDRLLRIYSGRRSGYLEKIKFRTSFPALKWDDDTMDIDEDSPPCRPNTEEILGSDQYFTAQIRFMFSTIKALQDRLEEEGVKMRKLKLTVFSPTQYVDQSWFCFHQTYSSWRVHLLSPDSLPSLLVIHSLKIKNGANLEPYDGHSQFPAVRKIDWRIILDLAAKMPHLNKLKCKIGGDEWASNLACNIGRHHAHDYEGPRRDSRRDFGEANVIPPSLRYLDLDFLSPLEPSQMLDHRKRVPDLVAPYRYDHFSTSLRMRSYQLRRMNLRGVFDSTLFWPNENTSPLPPRTWPCLESLSVMFHVSSPSGTWYFNGLRNELAAMEGAMEGFEITNAHYPPLTTTSEDEEMDSNMDYIKWDFNVRATCRVVPNDDTLVPFLSGFAKAMGSCMPSLKEAILYAPLTISADDISPFYENYRGEGLVEFPTEVLYNLAWGLFYSAPGEKSFRSDPPIGDVVDRRLSWKVGKWRPSPDLHHLFQHIGQKQYGDNLVEHWHDREYGRGLVNRKIFERIEARMSDHRGIGWR